MTSTGQPRLPFVPIATFKPCAWPACPALVRGHPHCEAHTKANEARRGTAHQRGYDARWRKARLEYLARNPLCAKCTDEGHVTAATVVDHRVAHKGDQQLFWDESNWQPSCKPHHDSRVDEGDFGRAHG